MKKTSYSSVNKSIIFVVRMKFLLVISLFISALCLIGCNGTDNGSKQSVKEDVTTQVSASGVPVIEFDTIVNNLGNIIEGEQVITYFKYHNSGNAPLVIHSIKAGCGCTVPQWSEEPLQANEEAKIKVLFNSSGKRGSSKIRITVNSNASTPVSTLLIMADVV